MYTALTTTPTFSGRTVGYLSSIPNELLVKIMSCMPQRDLARLACCSLAYLQLSLPILYRDMRIDDVVLVSKMGAKSDLSYLVRHAFDSLALPSVLALTIKHRPLSDFYEIERPSRWDPRLRKVNRLHIELDGFYDHEPKQSSAPLMPMIRHLDPTQLVISSPSDHMRMPRNFWSWFNTWTRLERIELRTPYLPFDETVWNDASQRFRRFKPARKVRLVLRLWSDDIQLCMDHDSLRMWAKSGLFDESRWIQYPVEVEAVDDQEGNVEEGTKILKSSQVEPHKWKIVLDQTRDVVDAHETVANENTSRFGLGVQHSID